MSRKNPFALRSIRLPFLDVEAWQAAAAQLKISKSEFLRRAIRDKAHRLLDQRSEQHQDAREESAEQILI